MKPRIRVVGAGLAGAEAIFYLARRGYRVEVYEQKKVERTPAQNSDDYGELVCSNSLKSDSHTNACGLLKAELRSLDSLVMAAAEVARIPSGQDLAVDRQAFSSYITERLKALENVTFFDQEYASLIDDGVPTIIATGPLTSRSLLSSLQTMLGEEVLSFFDAAAPLVFAPSLDMSKLFKKSRYDKGEGNYLNSPLSQEEYDRFYRKLLEAERVELHDFDHFEGCLPVEVMASRGPDTLLHGPLKPTGLTEQLDFKPTGVVQLRQDDAAEKLYGLVGFQTNLTYAAQKEVFSLIPGLEKVKFARFGLMHRNSYLCAPQVLNRDLSLKKNSNIFIAGQLSGVEGYVESSATGLLSAVYLAQRLERGKIDYIPLCTMLGSLVNYLVMSSSKHFQPINATYGILQSRTGKDRQRAYEQSLAEIEKWKQKNQ